MLHEMDYSIESQSYLTKPHVVRKSRAQLYDSVLRYGNFFQLDFNVDFVELENELLSFKDKWVQYNPYKPDNKREGLSLTSLNGEFGGHPDLYSLREYHRRGGKLYSEMDFRVATPAYHALKSLHPILDYFKAHLGRTHILRFGAGGFFPPHRDGAYLDEPDTIRIIVPLNRAHKSHFVFLHDNRRLNLDIGNVYFVNTQIAHSVFAFADNVKLLVCNVDINEESVVLIRNSLAEK